MARSSPERPSVADSWERLVSRRTVLKGIAGVAGVSAVPGLAAACSSTSSSTSSTSSSITAKGGQLTVGSNASDPAPKGGLAAINDAFTSANGGTVVKTNTVDHGFAAIEQRNRKLARGRSHGLLHRFELAFVILVVAGQIEHGLLEGLSCPLDPRRAVGYVPREHDHVGIVCGRHEGREFQVQVGIDSDAQSVSVRAEE